MDTVQWYILFYTVVIESIFKLSIRAFWLRTPNLAFLLVLLHSSALLAMGKLNFVQLPKSIRVRALCSVFRAPCSVLRAPCSVLRAPCSVLRAPCSVFRVACSVLRAPCKYESHREISLSLLLIRAPCSVLRVSMNRPLTFADSTILTATI